MVELSNVWMAWDQRAEFYQKKGDEKIKTKETELHEQCDGKGVGLVLPFKCDSCGNLISTLNEKRHRECQKCRKKICLECMLRSIKTIRQLKHEFPELKEIDNCSIYKGKGQFPKLGLIADLNSKKVMIKRYQAWEREGVRVLLTKSHKGKVHRIF